MQLYWKVLQAENISPNSEISFFSKKDAKIEKSRNNRDGFRTGMLRVTEQIFAVVNNHDDKQWLPVHLQAMVVPFSSFASCGRYD